MRLIAKIAEQKYEMLKAETNQARQEQLHAKFVGGLSCATYREETKIPNKRETLTALVRACEASNTASKANTKSREAWWKESEAFQYFMNVWSCGPDEILATSEDPRERHIAQRTLDFRPKGEPHAKPN